MDLNIANILKIAKDYGVDAVHPDYGFLSENFNFISALESAEIIFIGLLVKGIKNYTANTHTQVQVY